MTDYKLCRACQGTGADPWAENGNCVSCMGYGRDRIFISDVIKDKAAVAKRKNDALDAALKLVFEESYNEMRKKNGHPRK